MTLKDIRAMFRPGDSWARESSFLPGVRKVGEIIAVTSGDFVWSGVPAPSYAPVPRASEVLEARPGYLRYAVCKGSGTLTFTKVGD